MVVIHGTVNIDALKQVAAQILRELQEKEKEVAWVLDYESEINAIESAMSSLSDVISEIRDCPYFDYLIGGYEDDLNDMQQRLDELYEMQNEQYDTEMRQLNKEYEEARLWTHQTSCRT